MAGLATLCACDSARHDEVTFSTLAVGTVVSGRVLLSVRKAGPCEGTKEAGRGGQD